MHRNIKLKSISANEHFKSLGLQSSHPTSHISECVSGNEAAIEPLHYAESTPRQMSRTILLPKYPMNIYIHKRSINLLVKAIYAFSKNNQGANLRAFPHTVSVNKQKMRRESCAMSTCWRRREG